VAFQALAVLLAFGALMRARRDAEERERLMAEFESAPGELRRYADRVRDLTVATERTRGAREMHDSVGHYLTVINLALANALRVGTRRNEGRAFPGGPVLRVTRALRTRLTAAVAGPRHGTARAGTGRQGRPFDRVGTGRPRPRGARPSVRDGAPCARTPARRR
jgi:hypothetical protein